MSFVRKNITIPEEQDKFLSENSTILSRVVQKSLSYMMESKTTVLSKDEAERIFCRGVK
ncbi:hypothetical protein ApAK_03170 [Thermoplasmatales archaeon AK]|nr:hypothetical protein [Thermoplasmatales archaeon AK]